ncbi:MAG TPA: hypothetical protein VMX16_12790 [Terriglobia bacterium]|nr:hypothetical protein [Terriglobia bacterium]
MLFDGAAAHVCNNCRIKTDCTDSDDGRSIEQELDSWLQSQIGWFHRGDSRTLMLLAGVILIAEALRRHLQSEEVLLYSLLGGVGIFGTVLLSGFLAG